MKKTMLLLLVLGALSSVMAQNDGVIRLPILNYGNPQFPGIEFQLPVLTQPDNYQPPVHPIPFQPSGFNFDSHSRPCWVREYALKVGGEITVEFEYKVVSNPFGCNLHVSKSAVVVSWDGKEIGKVFPESSGTKIKFSVSTSKGHHQLSFCPSGSSTEKSFQISIKNIAVSETQCVGGWGKNIVKNGDFEINDCCEQSCIFNTNSLNANSASSPVRHWISGHESGQIEVGKAYVYNANLGTSWVSELDANGNTCIKQKVPIQAGRVRLEFDYAAKFI
jgi:hypothetical protein